jgi:histidinol-phosphate/aromatic aminotransferase/cobyric acid decarboxylase-like protein
MDKSNDFSQSFDRVPLKSFLIRDCTSFEELGDRYFRVVVCRVDGNGQLLAEALSY